MEKITTKMFYQIWYSETRDSPRTVVQTHRDSRKFC